MALLRSKTLTNQKELWELEGLKPQKVSNVEKLSLPKKLLFCSEVFVDG